MKRMKREVELLRNKALYDNDIHENPIKKMLVVVSKLASESYLR